MIRASNITATPYPSSSTASSPTSSSSSSPTSAAACSIDESYKYVFLPVCYSLTFLFSVTLNSVVLLRSCRHHGGCRRRGNGGGNGGGGGGRRWNTSLIYMVNLATTDLMYGLSLPFLVASYMLHDHWVFGDFMCRLVRFLFYFNLYCSIFFLTCISVHRYLGICHPMRTITLESKRAVKSTCVLVWLVVFILTCPIFRFAQTGFVGYINCWDDAIDEEFSDYVPYGMVLHLLGFFVPFSIIAWCYSQVVRTIFRTLRSPPSSVGGYEDGSIKTIVTITLLFALCFLPFHVTRTLFLLLRRGQAGSCNAMKAVSICYKVTRPLASCNAWLNALLYFLTGDKGPPCCSAQGPSRPHPDRRNGALWWPLKILKKEGAAGEEEPQGEERGERRERREREEREMRLENESKSSRVIF
uniref:G-protein coupled receptors family 1 profile domain-containing protein n=1 Tax=Gadus morhua TaxID=8049 RepID=A0A8C5AUL4_GADMO